MKTEMTAMEVVKTIQILKILMDELIESITDECGKDNDCKEVEEAVNIKVPDFLLEEAGIPIDAKLCACTEENSGVVKVMEAEYTHDLSDVPKDVLQILKSQGVSLSKLNESLMTEEIIYGK